MRAGILLIVAAAGCNHEALPGTMDAGAADAAIDGATSCPPPNDCPTCPMGSVCIAQGFERYAPVCRPACNSDDDCALGTVCLSIEGYDHFPAACFSSDVHELCSQYPAEGCLEHPDHCADATILEHLIEAPTVCDTFERIRCPNGCGTFADGGVPIGRCK